MNGAAATKATGPRSTGGRAVRGGRAPAAADGEVDGREGPAAVQAQSTQNIRRLSASWLRCFTRKQFLHVNSLACGRDDLDGEGLDPLVALQGDQGSSSSSSGTFSSGARFARSSSRLDSMRAPRHRRLGRARRPPRRRLLLVVLDVRVFGQLFVVHVPSFGRLRRRIVRPAAAAVQRPPCGNAAAPRIIPRMAPPARRKDPRDRWGRGAGAPRSLLGLLGPSTAGRGVRRRARLYARRGALSMSRSCSAGIPQPFMRGRGFVLGPCPAFGDLAHPWACRPPGVCCGS